MACTAWNVLEPVAIYDSLHSGGERAHSKTILHYTPTIYPPRYVFEETKRCLQLNPLLSAIEQSTVIFMFSRNATILTVNCPTVTSSDWTHLIASSLAISRTQIVPSITQRLKDDNTIKALRVYIFLYQCPRYQISQTSNAMVWLERPLSESI